MTKSTVRPRRGLDQSLRDIAAIANILAICALATLLLIYLVHYN